MPTTPAPAPFEVTVEAHWPPLDGRDDLLRIDAHGYAVEIYATTTQLDADHKAQITGFRLDLRSPALPEWPRGFRPLRGHNAKADALTPHRLPSVRVLRQRSGHGAPRTGDAAFDDAARVRSPMRDAWVDALLARPGLRWPIQGAFELGYNAVELFGDDAPVRFHAPPARVHLLRDPDTVQRAAQLAVALADSLPPVQPRPQAPLVGWLRRGARLTMHIGAACLVLVNGALLTHIPDLLSWTLFWGGFAVGLAAWWLTSGLRALWTRRRSRYAPRTLSAALAALMALAGSPLLGAINSLHDGVERSERAVFVSSTAFNNTVTVRGTTRAPSGAVYPNTDLSAFDLLTPGAPVRVVYYEGRLGVPVLARVEPRP